MKKRLASLQAGLLALVLLFSLLPVSSFATELDAAPDSVITTQEDAAADRNTAAEESGEHTSSASDAQPAAGGTESTASDSSAGTEQDEILTSAPSDTTSEAADTVEIPNTQDAAHEDDVNRMVAVQDTGFSAADFPFMKCGHGQVRVMNVCDWKSRPNSLKMTGNIRSISPMAVQALINGMCAWKLR